MFTKMLKRLFLPFVEFLLHNFKLCHYSDRLCLLCVDFYCMLLNFVVIVIEVCNSGRLLCKLFVNCSSSGLWEVMEQQCCG